MYIINNCHLHSTSKCAKCFNIHHVIGAFYLSLVLVPSEDPEYPPLKSSCQIRRFSVLPAAPGYEHLTGRYLVTSCFKPDQTVLIRDNEILISECRHFSLSWEMKIMLPPNFPLSSQEVKIREEGQSLCASHSVLRRLMERQNSPPQSMWPCPTTWIHEWSWGVCGVWV